MMQIKYTSECNCGGTMSSTTLDLTQEPGGAVTIDLDMLGGFSLTCKKCGCVAYLGDATDGIYVEDPCTHDGSDDEDDDDE